MVLQDRPLHQKLSNNKSVEDIITNILSPDMTTIGEIELKALPNELSVQWKIKDFFLLSEKVYSSCFFSFANESWCLRIYPNGDTAYDKTADGYISVYLRKMSSNTSIEFQFSFRLKILDEKLILETNKTGIFGQKRQSHGFTKFLSRSELSTRNSELAPSDMLTIICSLKYPKSINDANTTSAKNNHQTIQENELCNDEEDIGKKKILAKIKRLEILSDNLKQVLLDGRMSDAVLKTDGQEFNVHKLILSARSPVFASMFQHDLAEKNTNEVDIPDCTAESFEVFLHYLYTGSIETLSTSNVYNVYYAADKYQVDDLKENCVNFMIENTSVETFCDVIALSLRHGETKLQKTATEFFCQNIKKIIKTVEWIKYMDANAVQANELLIKALNA